LRHVLAVLDVLVVLMLQVQVVINMREVLMFLWMWVQVLWSREMLMLLVLHRLKVVLEWMYEG